MSLESASNIKYKSDSFYENNNVNSQSNFNSQTNERISKIPFNTSNKRYIKGNQNKAYPNSHEFQEKTEREEWQDQEENEDNNEEYEKQADGYGLDEYYENEEYYNNADQTYDENEKDLTKECDEYYYDEEKEGYLNNQVDEYYDNEKEENYRNRSSNQLVNTNRSIICENNDTNNSINKENEYNVKSKKFTNRSKGSKEEKIIKEFSKNLILNNIAPRILKSLSDKGNKNLRSSRNSLYIKTSIEGKNKKSTNRTNNINNRSVSNTNNSSSTYDKNEKKRDKNEKKKNTKLSSKNDQKDKRRNKKTKEFSVYEIKGYIPTSYENNEIEKEENKSKKNKNKNVYFNDNNKKETILVNNNTNPYTTHDNDLYKNIYYYNNTNDNMCNGKVFNIQEQIQLPYGNPINAIKTTNEIYNYPNINDNYNNNIIATSNVNYENSKSYSNPNDQVVFVPQEQVYVNPSHNMIELNNVIHKLPGNASSGMVKTKNKFYKFPILSPKKKLFCNSSKKNAIKKKKTDNLKTEILIYRNDELNNFNKSLMNAFAYNNDINRHNYFMPTSNSVFVRTRSLTPYSHMNKRNNKVSPLKNICIRRQKSLPIVQTEKTKPFCTHEVSYMYSKPNNNSPFINTSMNNYAVGIENPYQNKIHLPSFYDTNEDKKKRNIKLKDPKNYKKTSNKSSTKCSTGSSDKDSNCSSTLNSNVYSLNEKVKKLHKKINNMNKENNNLNELSKLYKNECNRLRELFVKNNFAKSNSSNIGNVDYEKLNLKLEEENEKLRSQMKTLGKTILASDDIKGIKKVLAKQIVDLQEENEKYRNKIKLLKKNNDINNEVLFNLNKTDISADAIDSIFMQTKNVIIKGHESINVFYLNLKNLIEQFFEKIKYIIMENTHTKKEKISYVNNLEEIIKGAFEELNDIVFKLNELRKNMKNMKAQIFDLNRGNPYCACKPSRIILEEDIKHLEDELHKHSLLLKNLRKKNLSLNLNNIYSRYSSKDDNNDSNSVSTSMDFYEEANKNKIYEKCYTTDNSHPKKEDPSFNSLINVNAHKNNKKEDNVDEHLDEKNASKLDEENLSLNDKNTNEAYHSKLHEKIKIIEEQLNSLNNQINYNYSDDGKDDKKTNKNKKKDIFLVDKLIKNMKDGSNYFNNVDYRRENNAKKNFKFKEHRREESSYYESESSHSSSSYSSSSSDENENLFSEKNKWTYVNEVEKSKNKMIELLALLKGKDNDDLIENTKHYVNAFGQRKSQNKYNLKKIYDNLNAIKNTIKNTDDDTEKNILAMIESQANEIKIFGNCVDDLKNTVIS